MSKQLFGLAVIWCLSAQVNAQWVSLETNSLNTLWAIESLDQDVVVAVGSYGKVLKTYNGGTDWSNIMSPVNYQLYDVDFYDQNIGIAVGEYTTILRTTNGGDSWVGSLMPHDNTWWSDVEFMTANIVFTIGYDAKIRKSVDGGASWPDSLADNISSDKDLKGLWYFSNDEILICGEDGVLIRSIDLGSTWTISSIPNAGTLRAMTFIDDQKGFVVGDQGAMYATLDGGSTWESVTGISTVENLQDVKFVSNLIGYAIGENGAIFRTLDAGTTWILQPWNGTDMMNSIAVFDENISYVCGSGGTILTTSNGGDVLVSDQIVPASKLYHNANSNTLLIQGKFGSAVKLSVFSISGKLIMESVISEDAKTQLPIELNRGIYFYQLQDQEGFQSGKLFVN